MNGMEGKEKRNSSRCTTDWSVHDDDDHVDGDGPHRKSSDFLLTQLPTCSLIFPWKHERRREEEQQ